MELVKRKIGAKKLKRVADIFTGLAHPVRLEIVGFLEHGQPVTVGEILSEVKIDPTLLTHHLTKMKHIGILDSRREGRNVFYKLAIPEITKVFDCIENCTP